MVPRSLPSSIYLLAMTCGLIVGCGSPNRANIQLRKQVQSLQEQVAALQQTNQARQQMIASLQNAHGSVETLPAPKLRNLFVAYGIKFARLTGGADLNPDKPGDEGIKAYVSPTDENGIVIQAAGSFIVEAYDLELKGDNRIGRWEFPTPATRNLWHSLLLDAAYELTCPWQKLPVHPNITLKVQFKDELTQATFDAQKLIQIRVPPTPPAVSPVTRKSTGGS